MEVKDDDAERLRMTKFEEALEIQSLRRIISAYRNYPDAAEEDVRRYERSYKKLSPSHQALLAHFPSKFQSMRRCISANSFITFEVLRAFEPPFEMSHAMDVENANIQESDNCSCLSVSSCEKLLISKSDQTCNGEGNCNRFKLPNDANEIEVRSTLRTIVRDWSIEGKIERDQSYKHILEELDRLFPNREKSPPTCLVPGAGLGRLAWEISCLGFMSQGIDFSYYMMIFSNFILNKSKTAEEWTIYPWIHSNCNSLYDSDQFRPVSFPDIPPSSGNITEGFSMSGGDFIKVYSDPSQAGAWDAVVTCFFIDTAHNIVEYIEIIFKLLKDGGVWINLGPLLYSFADSYGQDEMSIELSLEDVKKVALNFGFQIEKEMTIETTFAISHRSMMQNHYYCAFWTMRKKPVAPTKDDTP